MNKFLQISFGLLFWSLLAGATTVQGQCPTADFKMDKTYICQGEIVTFTDLSDDTCVTNRTWNFGDGFTSNVENPTHQYNDNNDKTFVVSLCIYDSSSFDCHYDTLYYDVNCVWPGDVNYDGVANNYDVLNIGVAYGDTGFTRPTASLLWTDQYGLDWAEYYSDTTFGVVNYKHADCNGNSVINAADTLAIALNYQKTHNKKPFKGSQSASDPPLYFDFPSDSVPAGQQIDVNIKLGIDTLPANNVYGLAFCVNYDPSLVDSGSVAFHESGSQLGSQSELLSMTKDFPLSGQSDIAVVRNNQLNTSTSGKIGSYSIVMEDDLASKDSIISKVLRLDFCDAYVISKDMSRIPVTVRSDSIIVYQKIDAITSPEKLADEVRVFPNPVDQQIVIETQSNKIQKVELLNLVGKVVGTVQNFSTPSQTITVDELPAGLYFIRVHGRASSFVKKVQVVH